MTETEQTPTWAIRLEAKIDAALAQQNHTIGQQNATLALVGLRLTEVERRLAAVEDAKDGGR